MRNGLLKILGIGLLAGSVFVGCRDLPTTQKGKESQEEETYVEQVNPEATEDSTYTEPLDNAPFSTPDDTGLVSTPDSTPDYCPPYCVPISTPDDTVTLESTPNSTATTTDTVFVEGPRY